MTLENFLKINFRSNIMFVEHQNYMHNNSFDYEDIFIWDSTKTKTQNIDDFKEFFSMDEKEMKCIDIWDIQSGKSYKKSKPLFGIKKIKIKNNHVVVRFTVR